MFEMTISTSKAKNRDISFILNKLRPSFKSLKGIMVCEEFDGRVKLALAVNEDKKDLAIGYIFDAISEAIIRGYKEEFLLENLKINISNKITLSTFVKALTMFDKVNDKELIKRKIVPSQEIFLDSFYRFRLWDLEKRWKDIASLVSDNSGYLLLSGSFTDLMKFLILTNEVEFGDLHIFSKKDEITAEDKDGKLIFNIDYKSKDDNSKINVISEIICLSPRKIIIHDNSLDRELCDYLIDIFDGKVSIVNNY